MKPTTSFKSLHIIFDLFITCFYINNFPNLYTYSVNNLAALKTKQTAVRIKTVVDPADIRMIMHSYFENGFYIK